MKRKYTSKLIILITSIIMMNFVGVSYAYWTDGLGINAHMTTSMGEIHPKFCTRHVINKESGIGALHVSFDEKKHTMTIQGEVEPGYEAALHYCIVNDGSVPVKYDNQNDDTYKNASMSMVVVQPNGVIKPKDNSYNENGNPQIDIVAHDVGEFDFEIDLPFIQWLKE